MDEPNVSPSYVESIETQAAVSEDNQHSGSRQPLLNSSESPEPSLPLAVTQKRKRIGRHLLLTTLVVVALSSGFAIVLLLWVIHIHGIPTIEGKSILMGAIKTRMFLVDEGTVGDQNSPQSATLRVLTFSSIMTQIVAVTAPLLVMMAAYCTAGVWLAQQEQSPQDDSQLPTPAQFGFLVKLSSTTGIVAIYETARYLIVGIYQKRRESAPSLFYASMLTVVAIYSITHLLSGTDLWLHLTSSAIIWNVTLPISSTVIDFSRPLPPDAYLLGVTFNDSLCSGSQSLATHGYPCLLDTWNSSSSVSMAGEMIAFNTSLPSEFFGDEPNPHLPISVVILHDESDLAVIVPSTGSSNASLAWTAPSYGLRISCQSMTEGCQSRNCANAGFPNFPPSQDLITTFSFDNGSSISIYDYYSQGGQLSNPYDMQFFFFLPMDSEAVPETNFIQVMGEWVVAFARCGAEFFNVTIRHDAGDMYGVVDGTMERSSDAFAAIMSGPLLTGQAFVTLSDYLTNYYGLSESDDSVLAALNQEMARKSLGTFAGSVIPVPAFTVTKPALVSRYPAPPLLVYVSLLFLYSTLVLVIFAGASTIDSPVVRACDGTEATSLKLGQSLLTDPLTLVGLMLPQPLLGAGEGLLLREPIDIFGEGMLKNRDDESGEAGGTKKRFPRLALGVVDEGPKSGLMFGVHEWMPDNSAMDVSSNPATLVEAEVTQAALPEDNQHPSSHQPLLTSSESPESRPPLAVTQERKRMGWHLLLTTFVIIASSAGVAIGILLWVIFIHKFPAIDGKSVLEAALEIGAFLVDEGTTTEQNSPQSATLRVLTFSSITTQLVALTAPVLVMMAAYCTVGAWLAQQERNSREGQGLPTPAQFGFLVKLSSTAGIISIYETSRYVLLGAHKKRRESAPVLFYAALASVVAIYSITHSISGADLWLHLTSSAIIWNVTLPISSTAIDFSQPLPPDAYLLGVTFNDTLCSLPFPDFDNATIPSYPCMEGAYVATADSTFTAGNMIAINISFTSASFSDNPNPRLPISVVTLHDEDDLAVIVPSTGRSNESSTWTAPSYGLRISCQSTTKECLSSQNCTTSIDSYATVVGQFANPYQIQLGLAWEGFPVQNASLLQYNGTFITMLGNAFATCQVECFNITLRHNAGDRYSVVNGTMERSSDAVAAIMSASLLSDWSLNTLTSQLDENSPMLLIQSDDSNVAYINQELSRMTLGYFAGTVIPAPAFGLTKPSLISRYPVLPLLAYVSLLFLYSILVLVIFVWASTIKSAVLRASNGKETTSLQLGQSLLTDPLALVGLALPQSLHGIDETSPLKNPVDTFGETSGDSGYKNMKKAPRLRLGPVVKGPSTGMFGVQELKVNNEIGEVQT